MGIPVLILGESGSGKSASMRNFAPEEVSIFAVASKPLPFRKKLPKVDEATYNIIYRGIKQSKKKTFVIDDSQYLMAFELFARVDEKGYDKFTRIAVNFKNLLTFIINETPKDVIVYLLHHTEIVDDKIKMKTVGKMLDQQLTVEGLFSIILLCQTDGTKHKFITQSDGSTLARSPMDMFPLEIDNDLKYVDETIRKYYFTEE